MFVIGLMVPLVWSWTCDHDKLQRLVTVKQIPQMLGAEPLAGERLPIRILFDTTYIDSKNPEGLKTCQSVGDKIQWGGDTHTCIEGDLWTEEKSKVIKGTFQNVERFLESILKVWRVSGSWIPKIDDTEYPSPRKEVSDTDLYVVLYPRPYGEGSGTLASATYLANDKATYRPVHGVVNLNLARLPKKVQDFSTEGDRGFFETALHEMCHILGISNTLFPLWGNITAATIQDGSVNLPSYNQADVVSTRVVDEKTMTIWHTPRLHRLMTERLGVEYFDGKSQYPVGVETEDRGGSGTAGSHWEQRVFFNELMVGATLGYARISEVTLCALEDTGWYDVDHSVAEPLEWGDYQSIRGATQAQFKDFASGKPVEVWPDHYVAKTPPIDKEGCTFDHRAVGPIQYAQRSCVGKVFEECEYPKFYDPKGTGYYGNPLMDYSPVVVPYSNRICSFEDTSLDGLPPGTYFGPNGMCARTTLGTSPAYSCFRMGCDENGQLSIGVGREAKVCKGKGDRLEFPNTGYDGYVECPDPNIVCGILGYNGTSSPIPEYTGADVKKPKSNVGLVVGIVIGIVAFIVIVIGIVVCICKSKHNHGDEQVSA